MAAIKEGIVDLAHKVKTLFTGRSHGEVNVVNDEIRIVLIGTTGSGKSSTGNTIVGPVSPKRKMAFMSMPCLQSVTRQTHAEYTTFQNKKIMVLDTPGFFDTKMSEEQTKVEIMKSVAIAAPGLHAVILVIGIGRFTELERKTVEKFKEYFGEGVDAYLIIVFTGYNNLEAWDMTLDTYIESGDSDFKDLMLQCNHRYLAINNNAGDSDKKMFKDKLLKMIDAIAKKNGGGFYTNDMLKAAEEVMKNREAIIQAKLEEEHRQEAEQIIREQQNMFDEKLTKLKQDFITEVSTAQRLYDDSIKTFQGKAAIRTTHAVEKERKKLEKQWEEELKKELLKQKEIYEDQLRSVEKKVAELTTIQEETGTKNSEDKITKREEEKATLETNTQILQSQISILDQTVAQISKAPEEPERAMEVKENANEDTIDIEPENKKKFIKTLNDVLIDQIKARNEVETKFKENMQQEARHQTRSEVEGGHLKIPASWLVEWKHRFLTSSETN